MAEVGNASAVAAEAAASAAEATADGVTQLSATRRYGNNMAAAVYGLILTGAILTAAEPDAEPAGQILVFMVLTLSMFWAAHVYSELLGRWATSGVVPDRSRWLAEMKRQWPMVGACIIPALILIASVVDLISDATAVFVALGTCTAELAFAGFLAARRGGGGAIACVASALVAFAFGAVLIFLKAVLH